VIKDLADVFGYTLQMSDLLDRFCSLLVQLTMHSAGASAAITEWNIIASLRAHLDVSLAASKLLGTSEESQHNRRENKKREISSESVESSSLVYKLRLISNQSVKQEQHENIIMDYECKYMNDQMANMELRCQIEEKEQEKRWAEEEKK
jgi:hypothetical protein